MPYLEGWQIFAPHWPRTTSAQIVTQEKAKSASQKCHGKFSMVGEHRVVCQDRRGGSEQRLGDWDPGSQQRSGTEQGTMQKKFGSKWG